MRAPGRNHSAFFAVTLASVVVLLSRSADRAGLESRGIAPSKAASPRYGGESASLALESRVAATRALEHMPLYFIENRGQLDARVAFYVQGRDTTLYFTAEGMTLALTEQKRGEGETRDRLERASLGRNRQSPQARTRHAVKLDFVGANPKPKILGADPTPTVVSYFKGRQEEWKAGLPTYASITYADLWPGIDLVYSGTADRLKYSFLVKPGADPGQVRLAYRGASGVRVNGAGQLEIETPGGVLQDDRPYAYQEIEGRRVAVGRIVLARSSAGRGVPSLRICGPALRPRKASRARSGHAGLCRLHRRRRLTMRATASPWTVRATPMSRDAPTPPRPRFP